MNSMFQSMEFIFSHIIVSFDEIIIFLRHPNSHLKIKKFAKKIKKLKKIIKFITYIINFNQLKDKINFNIIRIFNLNN